MRRILFVDDEPRILEGLRRMLRGQRDEWEMVFAEGGEAACAQLATAPFDVIVSDMRMPGIDGAALLKHVREKHPEMVRIILSGQTDNEAAYRAVVVAHQFLSKPCDADTVRQVVTRACELQRLLFDPSLRKLVSSMASLPSLPKTHEKLGQLLASPDVGLQSIARVVEQDMGMSAKILQIVNSSFFGLPQRLSGISAALNYLGLQTIRNLVLSVETFRAFEKDGRCPGFSIDALQSHSLATAHLASRMMPDQQTAQDAFTAGVLHDVGKLILATRMPEAFGKALDLARQERLPIQEAERRTCGVSHADMGAYLLGIWGLPYPIVEAVAFHHEPMKIQPRAFDLVGAVHIANVLHGEANPGELATIGGTVPALDVEYVRVMNLDEKISAWRQQTAKTAEA
jgi:HD-like signal output (HDOD) protein